MANGVSTNGSFAEQLDAFQLQPTTSQTVATGLGATPDQTKMIGTQAQTQATIQQRLQELPVSETAQRQELARAERLEAPRMERTVEEQLEAQRAEQLGRLGNIGLSIQNRIEQELRDVAGTQVGAAQVQLPALGQALGLDQAQVEQAKADPTSAYTRVSQALDTFLASGDPNDAEMAFATIDNLKKFGLSSADAKRLVGLTQETMARQTGQTVAANVLDQVTLADLDLQELGFTEGLTGAAESLNIDPEELGTMTIDEFQQAVEDKQQSEFARVEGLKAELAAAPLGSLQRDILMRELRDLGQVGITGVEAAVVETVEDINLADQVKVGDEVFKVSEFLDDEQLSQTIEDWIAADPAEKDSIIPEDQFPELVAWIRQNQEALGKLSTTLGETKEVFDAAQEQHRGLNVLEDAKVELNSDIMSKLIPDWDPSKAVTSGQLQDLQARLNSSTVGQIAVGDLPEADKRDLLNKINRVPLEQMDAVLALPPTDIQIASDAADALRESPELARFLGLEAQDFILDEGIQDRIADYDAVVSDIAARHPDWLRAHGAASEALKDLSPEQLRQLSAKPGNFDSFKDFINTRDRISGITSTDDALRVLTGDQSITLDELDSTYTEALKWARMGDRDAFDTVRKIVSMVGLPTPANPFSGTPNTLSAMGPQIVQAVSEGFNDDMAQALAGQDPIASFRDKSRTLSEVRVPTAKTGEWAEFQQQLSKGAVTISDLEALSPEQRDRLGKFVDAQPNVRLDVPGFTSYRDYKKDLDMQAFDESADRAFSRHGFQDLEDFYNWSGRVQPNQITEQDLTNVREAMTILEQQSNAATGDTRQLLDDLHAQVSESLTSLEGMRAAHLRGETTAAQDIQNRLAAAAIGAATLEAAVELPPEAQVFAPTEPLITR